MATIPLAAIDLQLDDVAGKFIDLANGLIRSKDLIRDNNRSETIGQIGYLLRDLVRLEHMLIEIAAAVDLPAADIVHDTMIEASEWPSIREQLEASVLSLKYANDDGNAGGEDADVG